MKTKMFKITAIVLMLAVSFSSCGKNEKLSDATNNVTGTIIGSYSNGSASLLVQVDKKYPIGKTFVYKQPACNLFMFNGDGTYKNVIQVQPYLPLTGLPEQITIENKRISFSFRAYRYGEEDAALFDTGTFGNAFCTHPDVPMYVITDCQILK
jgi:hypothetical protein